MKKIYWCEEVGTVYWLDDDVVMFAPMNNDNTADLDGGGEAEIWDDFPVTEAEVRAKLATMSPEALAEAARQYGACV